MSKSRRKRGSILRAIITSSSLTLSLTRWCRSCFPDSTNRHLEDPRLAQIAERSLNIGGSILCRRHICKCAWAISENSTSARPRRLSLAVSATKKSFWCNEAVWIKRTLGEANISLIAWSTVRMVTCSGSGAGPKSSNGFLSAFSLR